MPPVVHLEDARSAEEVNAPGIHVAQNRRLRDRAMLRTPVRYGDYYAIDFAEHSAPANYSAAIGGADASQWIGAIEDELKAHKINNTWEIIPRNCSKKTIDSRWVFKVIQGEDGSVRRYKARLCARGFLQEKDVDFTETFSPVVRYDSLRVLLATLKKIRRHEDLKRIFNSMSARHSCMEILKRRFTWRYHWA